MGLAPRPGARLNLIASLIVRNEAHRYLEWSVGALLEFCDEIRVLDDGSTDGTYEILAELDRVHVKRRGGDPMFEHEGRARNELLDWTYAGNPTHVLAVDADEIVVGGQRVRAACENNQGRGSWSLLMEEVWKADMRGLWTREDGGWRRHPIPCVWRVPAKALRGGKPWRIRDRQLACGREPAAVSRLPARPTGASVLHFGWANEAERQARFDRYTVADGGRFHADAHLQSILWPDSRVRLRRLPWPAGPDRELLDRVRCTDCAAA